MGAPGVNQPFDEDPLSPSSKPNANQQPYYPGPGQPFSPTGDQPGQGGPQGPGLGPTGAGTLPKAPVPQVGQKTPTEINVAPENIQPGQKLPPNAMTGEITTPSKRKMAPLLKNNDDETFAVDSAPVEVGKHQLVVRQNGREIRGFEIWKDNFYSFRRKFNETFFFRFAVYFLRGLSRKQ